MQRQQIESLLAACTKADEKLQPKLIETHISWVLLFEQLVYKIKKEIQYPFLDFSSLAKRKYYCEREVILNRRTTDNFYLGVEPVTANHIGCSPDLQEEDVIDYAVVMKRMNPSKQMDKLLLAGEVGVESIDQTAQLIANFHRHAEVVCRQNPFDVRDKFADLVFEKDYLSRELGRDAEACITRALEYSTNIFKEYSEQFADRNIQGLFRDVHGDLHSANIFLLNKPILFDCIEFNDDYRQIDILNDVAFLAMDLESFGKKDLSNRLIEEYKAHINIDGVCDMVLLNYYKCYRASVRTKINSLRARSASRPQDKSMALNAAHHYLSMMEQYLDA